MTVENQGQCRYFVTYTGVKLPFKLVNPLEEKDVEIRRQRRRMLTANPPAIRIPLRLPCA